MKLQKVYIKNFRGIGEEGVFIDLQGKTNLFIGENECCKTTILQAIELCLSDNNMNFEDLHNFEFNTNNNVVICCIFDENIKQDTEENERFNAIVHKTHIEEGDKVLNAKNQDKYLFNICNDNIDEQKILNCINNDDNLTKIQNATKTRSAVKQKNIIYYMPAIDLDDPSKSSEDKNVFEKVFENLNNNEEIKKILEDYDEKAKQQTKEIFANDNNGIAKILEEIFKIKNIDYEYSGSSSLKPSINIVRKYGDKQSKDLSHIGSGVRKIIKFIARLKFDGQQKSIFLIDEPEQNLHPKFQKLLIKFLKDEGIQCIFTSHSPTFVKHCMNNENCEVLICEKYGEKIEIKQMKEKIENDYKFLKNHTNSQAVANFLAFNEYSTDLFIQIYELLKDRAKEKYEQMKDSEKEQIRVDESVSKDCFYCLKNARLNVIVKSFFSDEKTFKKIKDQRNSLAHDNKQISDEDIKQSINEMIKLLK